MRKSSTQRVAETGAQLLVERAEHEARLRERAALRALGVWAEKTEGRFPTDRPEDRVDDRQILFLRDRLLGSALRLRQAHVELARAKSQRKNLGAQ